MLKKVSILLLGILLISMATAFESNKLTSASLSVASKNTASEKVILNSDKGEIECSLTKYNLITNGWDRVKGTFVDEKTGKFGAIDTTLADKEMAEYKYICSSSKQTYEKEGWYYFYDGNEKDLNSFIHIDFRDICLKEDANCKYERYSEKNLLFWTTNYLTVHFLSDKYIDPQFAGGAGTSISPYQITNWTALNDTKTSGYLDKYYVLMNNLSNADADYSGIGDNWESIGNSTTAWRFTGVFNGQGYTIKDLVKNNSAKSDMGLFGYIYNSTISNLNLYNVTFTGSSYVGGLVGRATGTTNAYSNIINCSIDEGNIIATYVGSSSYVGGLVGSFVGSSTSGIIYNSHADINVQYTNISGVNYVGGLVGYLSGGNITDSTAPNGKNIGNTGYSNYVGGLVGNQGTGNIINSSSSNIVRGASYLGGLVGSSTGSIINSNSSSWVYGYSSNQYIGGLVGYYNPRGTIIRIKDCNNTGGLLYLANSNRNVGGLVGYMNNGTIENSVYSPNIGLNANMFNVGSLVGYMNAGLINDSYTTGSITGSGTNTSVIGGLVGYMNAGLINNSYTTGNIAGTYNVGGLVGKQNGGTIDAAFTTGTIVGYTNAVGGLVGNISGGSIYNSYSTSNVAGYVNVGGLVGIWLSSGLISKSYSTGGLEMNGPGGYFGGLIGYSSGGSIYDSYSTGDVYALSYGTYGGYVGGLIGFSNTAVYNSYSTGNVTGGTNVGGLIGNRSTGITTSCYWDMNTSGQTISSGGTGLTTTQMKEISSFSGWDIDNVLIDLNNGYPYLGWQNGSSSTWLIYSNVTNCWTNVNGLVTIPNDCSLFDISSLFNMVGVQE